MEKPRFAKFPDDILQQYNPSQSADTLESVSLPPAPHSIFRTAKRKRQQMKDEKNMIPRTEEVDP